MKEKRNVLVVDDEKKIAETIRRYLVSVGYKADTASSGEDAMKKLKKGLHGIVILDIMLPGIDGVETVKKLRSIKADVKIIMLSGIDDEDLAAKSLRYGATDYICKPVDFNYLEKTLLAATLAAEG